MRTKISFVTNSSSTAFMIHNKTDQLKTLVDFVKENPDLIKEFLNRYEWHNNDRLFSQENLIISAEKNNIDFRPYENKLCVFGDEDGTLVGQVFDYILRDGGESNSFTWKFEEYYR